MKTGWKRCLMLAAAVGLAGAVGCSPAPGPVSQIPGGQGVMVVVEPATAQLALGGTQTFQATVTGSTNTEVTWSVQEGAAGGAIAGAGVYTAPATAGTYHVVATSQADASASATATVTVGQAELKSGFVQVGGEDQGGGQAPGRADALNADKTAWRITDPSQPIAEGTIVVGPNILGKVRRVTARRAEGAIEVEIDPANVEDVVKQGTVDLGTQVQSVDFQPSGDAGAGSRATRATLANLAGQVIYDSGYEFKYGGSSLNGQVKVDITRGKLDFSPDLTFRAEYGFPSTVEFEALTAVDTKLDMTVRATVKATGNYRYERELFKLSKPTLAFVGGFPVYATVTGAVVGGFNLTANATGTVERDVTVSGRCRVGATYQGGQWTNVAEQSLQAGGSQTVAAFNGDIDLTAYLKPTLTITLYETAGSSLDLKPYLNYHAAVTGGMANWTLKGGATSDLILRVSPLGLFTLAEHNSRVLDLNWTVRSGSDAVSGGGAATGEPKLKVFGAADGLRFFTKDSSKSLNLLNDTGFGTLTWTVTGDQPWLSFDPASGSGNNRFVTVTVDRSGLAAGVHSGKITVASNGGTVQVPVTLNVSTLQVIAQ